MKSAALFVMLSEHAVPRCARARESKHPYVLVVVEGLGILRLRRTSALQASCFAQDDKAAQRPEL
jgi:hypothetical protein